ncbi:MAG: hypothetical protein K2L94_00770 [Alphaproteobacteria bacterium]|nr:hypothetical protein [Alphaproteobacteria bacterium]
MIIIAFAQTTSRIWPRIVCRHFRHSAVIVPHGDKLVLYQFTRRGMVNTLTICPRDIQILGRHGWAFIYLPGNLASDFCGTDARTCVDMAKRAAGIRAPWVQTPLALYKYLMRRTL